MSRRSFNILDGAALGRERRCVYRRGRCYLAPVDFCSNRDRGLVERPDPVNDGCSYDSKDRGPQVEPRMITNVVTPVVISVLSEPELISKEVFERATH